MHILADLTVHAPLSLALHAQGQSSAWQFRYHQLLEQHYKSGGGRITATAVQGSVARISAAETMEHVQLRTKRSILSSKSLALQKQHNLEISWAAEGQEYMEWQVSHRQHTIFQRLQEISMHLRNKMWLQGAALLHAQPGQRKELLAGSSTSATAVHKAVTEVQQFCSPPATTPAELRDACLSNLSADGLLEQGRMPWEGCMC